MWLVSNASKQHGKGAYGWTITSASELLGKNTGLVYSEENSVTSYLVEAFGVLSLVVFLRRILLVQDCSFKTDIKIYCDNISMVNTAVCVSKTKADEDMFLQLQHELDTMKDF